MLSNLKLLREERGLSQKTIADLLGLTQPMITKYENGTIEPDLRTLKFLADYFETSVDFLIGRTDIRRKIEPTAPYDLNPAESELIDRFRNLSSEQRDCILMTIQAFLRK